jgi:signal transduction histidine kinase
MTQMRSELPVQDGYRAYWDEMPCYLSVHDPDLLIIDGNRRFRRDFGDRLGERCYRVYKGREDECPCCPVRATFADGESHSSEQVLTTLTGEERQVMVHTTPIRGGDGEVAAVMEMHTDIGEVKRMQSQLADIGLLVSQISHTMKGLIMAAEGGMYLVESGLGREAPARLEQGLGMARRNVQRMKALVMNVLRYAKERPPEAAEVDVAQLLREVCLAAGTQARDLGVELRLDGADGAGSIVGDPAALRAMLDNLVANALDACDAARRSAAHRVTLAARRRQSSLELEVVDDGVGMDEETRAKVFSLFFSTKGSRGTGLGTFIVRRIVEAHGGAVEVESEPGHGTCIRVRIPLEPPGPATAAAALAVRNSRRP